MKRQEKAQKKKEYILSIGKGHKPLQLTLLKAGAKHYRHCTNLHHSKQAIQGIGSVIAPNSCAGAFLNAECQQTAGYAISALVKLSIRDLFAHILHGYSIFKSGANLAEKLTQSNISQFGHRKLPHILNVPLIIA